VLESMECHICRTEREGHNWERYEQEVSNLQKPKASNQSIKQSSVLIDHQTTEFQRKNSRAWSVKLHTRSSPNDSQFERMRGPNQSPSKSPKQLKCNIDLFSKSQSWIAITTPPEFENPK
jgi:hypothetical protein